MSERFYVNSRLAPGPALLQGAEARHLVAALRACPGDQVYLFNGDGAQYPAEVVALDRQGVELRILAIEAPARELGFRLEIAAPCPKGDRTRFLIEKLTELGATDFVPLRTGRSVVHPSDNHIDKLRRYVIEASKQCGRNSLLRIASLTDWSAYVAGPGLPSQRLLAHVEAPSRTIPRGQDCAFAVGPEGGFTPDEVAEAGRNGWYATSLGPRTLRVETAALLLVSWSGAPCGVRQP